MTDEIWHAGDWGPDVENDLKGLGKTLRGVYGNIDSHYTRLAFPETAIFECEGVKVLVRHIGGFPGKYAAGVKELLHRERPRLFISGHSHILRIMPDPGFPGMIHMNPGAAGIHGFHLVRTMIQFKVDSGRIFDAQVIEMGKRG